ncbi:MAG: hypothetical protein KME16_26505 [Scytolyngbya sp. HA4215-MV1]|nr:hypothetical protein [Scytolyngbya sp. HA4215-MV1]
MDVNQLRSSLQEVENPKIEFKSCWYCNTDQLDDKGWGEFLKDLISLANGNVGYVDKTAYLIVGASDIDPKPSELRDTFHVPANGMLSNLQKLRETTLRKLREVCSPALSDIKIYFVKAEEGKDLLVIEIPPPIDVIKLDRDLNTRGIRFKKGTVLVRLGQDISVADPTEISILKQEHSKKYQKDRVSYQEVLHNLPQPDYINFVGRKTELEQLRKLLCPQDRIWTIVVDGIGGIGKSALALELAHRYLNEYVFLPQEERFEAIVWVSAKTSILTADGIKNRYHFISTIKNIFKEISIVLREDNINSERELLEQDLLIKRALGKQRTLLIVDNYETIDDERVNLFIRELPHPTKCIVTTRHRIDIADPIRLAAMPREDALALIRQECDKKGVQLSEEQIELLNRRTAGIPLAVVWSIAQVSHHGFGIDKVLRRLGDARGDIAQFCFESAIQDIKDKPAYKLLICITLALSSLRSSLSRQDIGYISDLSELDRDEGLVLLEKLSLINKDNGRFNTLPLVREYMISHISEINIDEIHKMVVRISLNYAPSGADAVSLIEKIFNLEVISSIKDEITKIVVDQMWEWDSQYDQFGVPYCIAALEQLATENAINNIKFIALNSQMYYDGWIYVDSVNALTRLERVKDLVDLTLVDKEPNHIMIDALKKLDSLETIKEIDQRLGSSSSESEKQLLQQLRDKFSP